MTQAERDRLAALKKAKKKLITQKLKGLRVAGVTTLEGANHYLETEFLPWCNGTLAVVPANPDDAHRPPGEAS
jgi:hypothetical protein